MLRARARRSPARLALLLASFGAAITCAHEAPPQLLAGLGPQHHPITTQSPLAQRHFDQGLNLCFGFNHEAAVRAFEAALEIDPSCAMCEWGIAFALGPNINAPMAPESGPRAYAAAVLLDAGRAAQAEAVYRADLERHPSNGWSLYGLAASLRAQREATEAEWAQRGFTAAWARADVALHASRF